MEFRLFYRSSLFPLIVIVDAARVIQIFFLYKNVFLKEYNIKCSVHSVEHEPNNV